MTFGDTIRGRFNIRGNENTPLLNQTHGNISSTSSINPNIIIQRSINDLPSCEKSCSPSELNAATTGVNWGGAAFLLVNTALGAGMLNYPYAYDQIGGIYAAALIQIILLIFISTTMFILAYCADFNKDDTYHDVLLSMCGKRSQQISAVSIMLTCYGICITFLVIIGDQFDRIFNSLCEDPNLWYLDRKFTIFMTSVLFIWPMCYAQRLDFLRHASALGMFAMLYVAFLTIYEHYVLDEATIASLLAKAEVAEMQKLISTNASHPISHASDTNQSQGGFSAKTFQFFNSMIVVPILCFAYQTHEVIVPVYACMKERSIVQFMKASVLALVILYFLYNLVGAYGYSTFGANVGPDIMSLYDAQDPIVVIGIIALVVKFITTYPPLMFCGRGALDGLYGEIRGLTSEELKTNCKTRRVIITTIWFFTTVILAVFAPDISITLQLLGSMASINVFVFPGMCLISLTSRLRKRRQYLLYDQENDINQNQAKDYYVISGSYYFGSQRKGVARVDDRTYSATFASLIEFDKQIAANQSSLNDNYGYNQITNCSTSSKSHAQRLTCYGSNITYQAGAVSSNTSSTLMSAGISKPVACLLYILAFMLVSFGVFIFMLELITVTGII